MLCSAIRLIQQISPTPVCRVIATAEPSFRRALITFPDGWMSKSPLYTVYRSVTYQTTGSFSTIQGFISIVAEDYSSLPPPKHFGI